MLSEPAPERSPWLVIVVAVVPIFKVPAAMVSEVIVVTRTPDAANVSVPPGLFTITLGKF